MFSTPNPRKNKGKGMGKLARGTGKGPAATGSPNVAGSSASSRPRPELPPTESTSNEPSSHEQAPSVFLASQKQLDPEQQDDSDAPAPAPLEKGKERASVGRPSFGVPVYENKSGQPLHDRECTANPASSSHVRVSSSTDSTHPKESPSAVPLDSSTPTGAGLSPTSAKAKAPSTGSGTATPTRSSSEKLPSFASEVSELLYKSSCEDAPSVDAQMSRDSSEHEQDRDELPLVSNDFVTSIHDLSLLFSTLAAPSTTFSPERLKVTNHELVMQLETCFSHLVTVAASAAGIEPIVARETVASALKEIRRATASDQSEKEQVAKESLEDSREKLEVGGKRGFVLKREVPSIQEPTEERAVEPSRTTDTPQATTTTKPKHAPRFPHDLLFTSPRLSSSSANFSIFPDQPSSPFATSASIASTFAATAPAPLPASRQALQAALQAYQKTVTFATPVGFFASPEYKAATREAPPPAIVPNVAKDEPSSFLENRRLRPLPLRENKPKFTSRSSTMQVATSSFFGPVPAPAATPTVLPVPFPRFVPTTTVAEAPKQVSDIGGILVPSLFGNSTGATHPGQPTSLFGLARTPNSTSLPFGTPTLFGPVLDSSAVDFGLRTSARPFTFGLPVNRGPTTPAPNVATNPPRASSAFSGVASSPAPFSFSDPRTSTTATKENAAPFQFASTPGFSFASATPSSLAASSSPSSAASAHVFTFDKPFTFIPSSNIPSPNRGSNGAKAKPTQLKAASHAPRPFVPFEDILTKNNADNAAAASALNATSTQALSQALSQEPSAEETSTE